MLSLMGIRYVYFFGDDNNVCGDPNPDVITIYFTLTIGAGDCAQCICLHTALLVPGGFHIQEWFHSLAVPPPFQL